jgi:hypothetical protein
LVIRFRDFLKFGGLLAADAVARFKRYDVACGAIIPHSKQLPVVHRVQPMNFEGAVRFGDALQAHLAAVQALVLQGVEKMRSVGGKRFVFAANLEQWTIAPGSCEFAFQHG